LKARDSCRWLMCATAVCSPTTHSSIARSRVSKEQGGKVVYLCRSCTL
jgi:hypothetical protein